MLSTELNTMADFEIIVGSMLGASEYVADALKESLQQHQLNANIALQAELSELDLNATWIICTSTHGAGDLPDNIQHFATQVKDCSFKDLKFLVIGLGDSSYDTFCFAAKQIQDLLQQAGATLLVPALHIDVLNHPIPEDHAVDWLESWLQSRT
jgi:MioC protein